MTKNNSLKNSNLKNSNIDNIDPLPILFQTMQNSLIMDSIYEYVIKVLIDKVLRLDFLKDKKKIKYVTISIFLLCAISVISILSYFLFYIMFFISALKSMLWLFEIYTPDISSNDDIDCISDISSHNVLEYYVIPIFLYLIMYPLGFLPIPGLSTILHGISSIICITCLTHKLYRQKCCLFIRNLFTNKESRDSDEKYVPGYEGEIHTILQIQCHVIDSVNICIYNLIHNPKIIFSKLNTSKNISNTFCSITSYLGNNYPKNRINRSNKIIKSQYNNNDNDDNDDYVDNVDIPTTYDQNDNDDLSIDLIDIDFF